MNFSLVLATVDRTAEVNRFLDALQTQTHRNFELIVVDQNADERVSRLLKAQQHNFSIIHIQRPDKRGVSRARNLGLQHISGDIVTFPDDDCWYPSNLLQSVDLFMTSHEEVDSLSGRMGTTHEQQYSQIARGRGKGCFLTKPLKIVQVPGPWSLSGKGSGNPKRGSTFTGWMGCLSFPNQRKRSCCNPSASYCRFLSC